MHSRQMKLAVRRTNRRRRMKFHSRMPHSGAKTRHASPDEKFVAARPLSATRATSPDSLRRWQALCAKPLVRLGRGKHPPAGVAGLLDARRERCRVMKHHAGRSDLEPDLQQASMVMVAQMRRIAARVCCSIGAVAQAHLVAPLPLVEQPRRREHLEDVVAKLIVGDELAFGTSRHCRVQPVPIVVRAAWRGVQLVCAANRAM